VPSSLWGLFPDNDRLPESEFVDAVSRNLRSGRVVVLIVGDGIRTETERLLESLQSHAGFRFTLALVELSVFMLPRRRGSGRCSAYSGQDTAHRKRGGAGRERLSLGANRSRRAAPLLARWPSTTNEEANKPSKYSDAADNCPGSRPFYAADGTLTLSNFSH
jgi:hypothetical protein